MVSSTKIYFGLHRRSIPIQNRQLYSENITIKTLFIFVKIFQLRKIGQLKKAHRSKLHIFKTNMLASMR